VSNINIKNVYNDMSDKLPEKVVIGGLLAFGLLLSNITITNGLIEMFENPIFRFSYLALVMLFFYQKKEDLAFLGIVIFMIMDYLVQNSKSNEEYSYAKEYASIEF
jgi:hypothetical protein